MECHPLESLGFYPDFQSNVTMMDALSVRRYATSRKNGLKVHHVYVDESGARIACVKGKSGEKTTILAVSGTRRTPADATHEVPGILHLQLKYPDGEVASVVYAGTDDAEWVPMSTACDGEFPDEYDIGEIYVGAIPVDVSLEEPKQPPEKKPLLWFGDEFLSNHFDWTGTEDTPPADRARASLSATVRHVERVTNRLTGLPWYKVDADCLVPITIALPGYIDPVPKPGMLISGEVLLSVTTGTTPPCEIPESPNRLRSLLLKQAYKYDT